jgi:hypothetical protein
MFALTMTTSPFCPHKMMVIEPDDHPTRTLTWKPMAFLSHIKRRTNDDRFSDTTGDLVLLQLQPRCPNPGPT